MKNRFPLYLILIFSLVPSLIIGQTFVSGTINSNTTWTLANSPYVVTNVVTVASGATLTIEPGVVLKHNYFSFTDMLVVEGSLTAEGTPSEPIVFTDIQDDTYGGDTNNDGSATAPSPGDWAAVRIKASSGSTSSVGHCLFRFGGDAALGSAALALNGASPVVQNNTFFQCEKGITATGGSTAAIQDNTFEGNTQAPGSVNFDVMICSGYNNKPKV